MVGPQGLVVVPHNKIRLIPRIELACILPDHFVARNAEKLFGGSIALGNVDSCNQASCITPVAQDSRVDGNVNFSPIRLLMSPDLFPIMVSPVHTRQLGKPLTLLYRTDVEHLHSHKLLAAISVVRDSGLVDCKETQIVKSIDPHWHWVALEK